MIIALPLRTWGISSDSPWKDMHIVWNHLPEIFGRLNVTLLPLVTRGCGREIEPLCDGLIIPGCSKNIYPEYYGQTRLPEMEPTYTVDEYAFDKELIDVFAAAGKPILGICGGIQSINVAFGGTLNQHVPGHASVRHETSLLPGSFLHGIYGAERIETNSYHGQCVLEAAPGFTVTARAADGTVEGIEKGNIIGVQWHPEVEYDMPFFEAFTERFPKRK